LDVLDGHASEGGIGQQESFSARVDDALALGAARDADTGERSAVGADSGVGGIEADAAAAGLGVVGDIDTLVTTATGPMRATFVTTSATISSRSSGETLRRRGGLGGRALVGSSDIAASKSALVARLSSSAIILGNGTDTREGLVGRALSALSIAFAFCVEAFAARAALLGTRVSGESSGLALGTSSRSLGSDLVWVVVSRSARLAVSVIVDVVAS